jgi:hypothetical protein
MGIMIQIVSHLSTFTHEIMVDLNLHASSIICLNEAQIKNMKVECNCDIKKSQGCKFLILLCFMMEITHYIHMNHVLVFGIVFKIVHDIMKNYAKINCLGMII